MTAVEVMLRVVFYATTLIFFGASLYVVYAPREVVHEGALRQSIPGTELACVLAALVSGTLALAVRAAVIGGESVGRTVSSGVLAEVIAHTLFGRLSTLRLCLIVLFGASLASARTGAVVNVLRAFVAAAILATLAWTGH